VRSFGRAVVRFYGRAVLMNDCKHFKTRIVSFKTTLQKTLKMNRRDLIQRVIVGGTVLVLAPSILESCTKGSSTDIGGVATPTRIDLELSSPLNSALSNTGGWIVVQNTIIINTGNGAYAALSSICTHQGCNVEYNSSSGNILCPCHGSQFATTGSVLRGPATRPLQTFPVSISGNILTILL
jgi:cytochrome b6-f complex iron-sulfur subunit